MRLAYGGGSADRPEAGGSTAMSCSYGRSGCVDAGHDAARAAAPAPLVRRAAMSPRSGAWWYGKYQLHDGTPSR